jgi:molybdopterin-guanine dinucleotide biosynthesis protein A
VLAGGSGHRLGDIDKPGVLIAGRTMLDRVLGAVAGASRVVVVGLERRTDHPVAWCREEPPGGGPVAAIATGLAHLRTDWVVVLAGDLPLVDEAFVQRLLDAAGTTATGTTPELDGAIAVDQAGREQPLAGAYRRQSLAGAVAGLGDPHGQAVRRLVAGLRLAEVADDGGAVLDCDSWDDIRRAEARLRDRREETDGAGAVDVRPGR